MKLLKPDQRYSVPQPQSEVEELLFQLQRTASKWYKTKDPEYVKQYHDLYHALRSLGWDGAIDIDAELPDNLMPQEYLSQVAEAAAKHRETALASSDVRRSRTQEEPERMQRSIAKGRGRKPVRRSRAQEHERTQHPKTEEVYNFIRAYIEEHHYPPSIREIAANLSLTTSAVVRHLDKLEAQERLTRDSGKTQGRYLRLLHDKSS